MNPTRLETNIFSKRFWQIKKDLINKHIHKCMGLEVKTQRDIEKSIQREGLKRVAGKVKGFFIRPTEEPKIPKECPSSRKISQINVKH